MIAVLLDKVTAYAAAVRSHLADLTPEQVDDLTDGLEADLAEAMEDATAGGAASSADEASVLDLTRRFGPAADYATELRAAAGLGSPAGSPHRRPLREAARAVRVSWAERASAGIDRIASVPGGPWLIETIPLLRPAWWLLRGWVWFVIAAFPYTAGISEPFVPTQPVTFVALLVFLGLSVEWARGGLRSRRWARRGLVLAQTVAVVAVVPLLVAFAGQSRTETVYIDGGAPYIEQPADGVIVDGMYVSNLFVYDAEGNPLHDVQIVDDRGRQVRTIVPDNGQEWSLPGVSEPWAFAPSPDVDGRDRWNVYPLLGAPVDEWTWTESGERELVHGSTLETPPYPFAKAPALRGAAGTAVLPSTGPAPGTATETAPSNTAPADSDPPTGTGAAETTPSGSTG